MSIASYSICNHLGAANLELDSTGTLLNLQALGILAVIKNYYIQTKRWAKYHRYDFIPVALGQKVLDVGDELWLKKQ